MYRFFLLAGPLSARHERAQSSLWTPRGRAAGPTIASGAQPVRHKPEPHCPPKIFFVFFSEPKISVFLAWQPQLPAPKSTGRAAERAPGARRIQSMDPMGPRCHLHRPFWGPGSQAVRHKHFLFKV